MPTSEPIELTEADEAVLLDIRQALKANDDAGKVPIGQLTVPPEDADPGYAYGQKLVNGALTLVQVPAMGPAPVAPSSLSATVA